MAGEKTSLYRKYRPRNWQEMCGQESVLRILQNSLKKSEVSHAYLFCGPRGTGKTSSAKIFAKAINCDAPLDGSPCLQCKSCLSFQKGNYPDFFEIDAASNRKIDDFREIREQVQYPPLAGKGKFKIYVIDEAHMLTKEAANAFLKTLEEPPAYIVFILATTEPEKLLPTILSRCIRLDFRLLSISQVKQRLQHIATTEKLEVDDAVYQKLIFHGEGGFRDILTLMERAIHYCGSQISLSSYLDMMGLTAIEELDSLLAHYYKHESGELVSQYADIIQGGRRPRDLFLQLLERVQSYIYFLLKIEGDYPQIPPLIMETKAPYWQRVYQYFLSVLDKMQSSFHPEMHGEIGLLQFVEHNAVSKAVGGRDKAQQSGNIGLKVQQLEKRLRQLELGGVRGGAAGKTRPVVQFKDDTFQNYPKEQRNWLLLKKDIKERNPMLHAVIEPAQLKEEDGTLKLVYRQEGGAFHFKRIQEERWYQQFVGLLQSRYGSECNLEIVLEEGSGKNKEVRKTVTKAITNAERPIEGSENFVSEELKDKLLQDDGLKKLVDGLGVEITDVK